MSVRQEGASLRKGQRFRKRAKPNVEIVVSHDWSPDEVSIWCPVTHYVDGAARCHSSITLEDLAEHWEEVKGA